MEKWPKTGENKNEFLQFVSNSHGLWISQKMQKTEKNLTLFCKKNYKKIGENPKKV